MSRDLLKLVSVVARLRRECPWDREQTPETIRTYVLEECYEVLEALDRGDPRALEGELGDLLFQILFLATLASERGWFDLDALCQTITRKMVDRHPHVFGDVPAKTAAEVKQGWERRKREQTGSESDPLGSIPGTLPAAAAAYRMTSRAADLGFDWERDADVAAKIEEELGEWRTAFERADPAAEAKEIGDLLLSVVNLARRRRIDPEAALRQTNARFRKRFAAVSRRAAASGRPISDIPLAELDAYWEDSKKEERSALGSRPSARHGKKPKPRADR
ncbi:MAG TPA: nucleoside triphosphate pyrophosphohydrolase [Thermoanaerobaculia bacterium]|nr:nucleoside triphosphate pyrophosphohydrolase [Thermoanaerobaculia bacterium]